MLIEDLMSEILQLAKDTEGNFLRLSKLLRELGEGGGTDEDGAQFDAFNKVLKAAGIGRRQRYYLALIDKVYGDLPVSRDRLSAIGWTKLALMANEVTPDNFEEWLDRADEMKAHELRAFVAGKEIPTHILTLRMTEKQYGVIAGTLLANGAYLTEPGGIANKEAALLKICGHVARAWKAGVF